MPVQRCPQCGTARRGDMQVCVRCETPFVDDDIQQALPRPAVPSPTQSHGTLMVLLLSGFVLLGVMLWLSVRDIGQFTARIVSSQHGGSRAVVTVEVRNEGDKTGRGRCLVGRVDAVSGDARQPYQFVSGPVPPGGTITQVVEVPLEGNVRATDRVTC